MRSVTMAAREVSSQAARLIPLSSRTGYLLPIHEGQIADREGERDQEDDHAQRACRAEVEELERFEVGSDDDGLSTARRAALGQKEDDGEGATETPDGDEQRQHDGDIAQARQGDMPERLYWTGAINLRGFVMFPRNSLEPRQEHDCTQGEELPDRNARQTDQGTGTGEQKGEFLRGDAACLDQIVEDTEFKVEHPSPDERRRHIGHSPGNDEERTRQRTQREAAIEKQCCPEADAPDEDDIAERP